MNPKEQLIHNGIETLEPLRFKYTVFYFSSWIISVILLLITIKVYFDSKDESSTWITMAVVSVVIVIIMIVVTIGKKRELDEEFDSWRNGVIHHIDSSAILKANECLRQDLFNASGLNSKYYNRYSGSNYLRVGDFQASYLSVKHEYKETYYETVTTTNSQGQSETRQERRERTVVKTVFNGLLLILTAPLPHAGWVILILQSIGIPNGLHKINVASPYLVNNYAIGVSEKFIGHRALTPSLMEALWDYRNQFNDLPGYSYQDSLLYITIPGVELKFGNYPNAWSQVTFSKLDKIISDCENSINFLKGSAEKLKPS